MTTNQQRFETVSELQHAIADAFCQTVEETLREQPAFRVSLSGGSTPKRLYELLAERDLPWDRIHWCWGDERNVPHDHADSNAKMVRDALLDRIEVPDANVHPVPVIVDSPAESAANYRETLHQLFPDETFPSWDLVLLGMGDDGHTASLFPHTAALQEDTSWFVENWVEKFDAYRYTLTAPAINSAKRIWFIVSGGNKRSAFESVMSDDSDAATFPSKLIDPTQWWLTEDVLKV